MNIAEHNRVTYGEAITDDESVCDLHGCRLGHYDWGWGCAECEAERILEEREECVFDNERDELRFDDDESRCRVIAGLGFVAISCTMPFWS